MTEEEIEQECSKAEQWREKDDEDKWEAHCQEQEEPCHYDEIQKLREDIKVEKALLKQLTDPLLCEACLDNIVRMSDQIEELDV